MTGPTEPRARAAGIRSSIDRRPRLWLYSTIGVVVALVATGSIVAATALSPRQADVSAEVITQTPTASPSSTPSPTPTQPAARVLPETAPAATRVRTCSIAAAAANPALGRFEGQVLNATTGEVLFDRDASTPAATASGMKLLTASAALSALGPDFRISTRVVQGAEVGTIVLVGGGDPTLSALPAGVESYYAGAPKLSDLAAQTVSAWQAANPDGAPITRVLLDATLWNTADKWDPTWQRSEQTIGYHSEVTALMVDGDRADPQLATSPRSTDPVARAGTAFVAALAAAAPGLAAPAIELGTAPAGAAALGEVQSQPVGTLLGQMLPGSDNTLAEMLARLISKNSGGDGSAASLETTIPGALAAYGLDTSGLAIRDGSGLSDSNGVPPAFMTRLMQQILAGNGDLDLVLGTLPVSGVSGTLAGRFTGANAVARGAVTAKTGFIFTAYTLTGIIRSADGTPLAFSFFAEDNVSSSAIGALDTITTAAFQCGDNLSNY